MGKLPLARLKSPSDHHHHRCPGRVPGLRTCIHNFISPPAPRLRYPHAKFLITRHPEPRIRFKSSSESATPIIEVPGPHEVKSEATGDLKPLPRTRLANLAKNRRDCDWSDVYSVSRFRTRSRLSSSSVSPQCLQNPPRPACSKVHSHSVFCRTLRGRVDIEAPGQTFRVAHA